LIRANCGYRDRNILISRHSHRIDETSHYLCIHSLGFHDLPFYMTNCKQ
jgi:hypothetical protein